MSLKWLSRCWRLPFAMSIPGFVALQANVVRFVPRLVEWSLLASLSLLAQECVRNQQASGWRADTVHQPETIQQRRTLFDNALVQASVLDC